MKCHTCQKKGFHLTCRECHEQFCTGCIQLEVHHCPNIKKRLEIEKELLGKKLVQIKSEKILKF
jgi:hypothetical protein